MRRLLRRNLIRDSSGRTLSLQSERLTDNGTGSIHVTTQQSAGWCSGCRRPITNLSELRGDCDVCHTRGCCVHCLSQCQVCSRRICGHCRRGFAGQRSLTVCADCQQWLIQRQAWEDKRTIQQAAFDREQAEFDREIARHRLFQQMQALQLQAERTRLLAEAQSARLGTTRRPLIVSVFNGIWWTVAKVIEYVERALR